MAPFCQVINKQDLLTKSTKNLMLWLLISISHIIHRNNWMGHKGHCLVNFIQKKDLFSIKF